MRCRGHLINEKFLCENRNRFWAFFSYSSCNLSFLSSLWQLLLSFCKGTAPWKFIESQMRLKNSSLQGAIYAFSIYFNEWKKNPSRCFQQIGFCLFLAFIWIFQLLNRLNSKSSNCFYKKQCKRADSAHFFWLLVFLSLHQPVTKN